MQMDLFLDEYAQGRLAAESWYDRRSPYTAGSPEDTAWNRGYSDELYDSEWGTDTDDES